MACFLVPATEAIVTTVASKVIKHKEKESVSLPEDTIKETVRTKFSAKLGWLNNMLWGGSALLAFEHLWHGEIVPYFPFLTAVSNGETTEMLSEMGSTGVMMAAIVTAAWAGMVAVSSWAEKKVLHAEKQAQENA